MNNIELIKLLEKARSGDSDALESLLRLIQPQLHRFSMNMCRHTEDAEDILQESLIAIVQALNRFKGDSSFSTWMYSIARSFCIKKRRKSKFAPNVEESWEQLPSSVQEGVEGNAKGPLEEVEQAEMWTLIQDALRTLDHRDRELIILRDIEGLRAKEVSEIVGLSVSAVKSRLHRARSTLRERLANLEIATPISPLSTCPDIRQLFSKNLEGELATQICVDMRQHIDECEICARECDGLKNIIHTCHMAKDEPSEVQQVSIERALRMAIETYDARRQA